MKIVKITRLIATAVVAVPVAALREKTPSDRMSLTNPSSDTSSSKSSTPRPRNPGSL